MDVKRCEKPINLSKNKGKKVFLSSVTDCYNDYEKKYRVTQGILNQLTGCDAEVSISTKSSLILRDLDILKKIRNLKVSMSINTLDESFRADMDHAVSIKERLETLKTLHENGIYTILFMSPIFPCITDWKGIIEASREYIDEYWENLADEMKEYCDKKEIIAINYFYHRKLVDEKKICADTKGMSHKKIL
ncbi:MAG: radical SAM protein [Lachnospiraceae bacterium]|nr:radical SAM protein [Lachnospiraceae bacterium]